MNGRSIGRLVGIVAAGSLLAACGCDGGGSSERSDAATVGPEAICKSLEIAVEGVGPRPSFSEMVEQSEPGAPADDYVPVIALMRNGDLGVYEPVVEYLVGRFEAWDPGFERTEAPARTVEVVASAERLDADLADGLCR